MLLTTAALATATPELPYRDGPPPGFSGGFEEQSCHACHFSADLNAAHGMLSIAGAPASYEPGETYRLVVTLARTDMVLGGFQLASRFEETGAQAGTIEVVPEERERVGITTDREVQYAHQLAAGATTLVPDTARWTVLWTAPASAGKVQIHAAGNAADGDDSTSGDYVYTTSLTVGAP